MSRWDILIRVLDGPMASREALVFRGPVLRVGRSPGPGGLALTGVRGLDDTHAVITAQPNGTATLSPVGTNQCRLAPHPNVGWGDIGPAPGSSPLAAGNAIHLGPPNRGCTIEFVGTQPLSNAQSGRLSSGLQATRIPASRVPLAFLGCLLVMSMFTVAVLLVIAAYQSTIRDPVALGPVDEGVEFYKSVDIDGSPISKKLKDGLDQAFYDFVMAPNITASGRDELSDPDTWDERFKLATTVSVQKHLAGWSFFKRLELVKNEYSFVLGQTRRAGLPDVFAAIPYQESRYDPDIASELCAKGYWQFMPETAHRLHVRQGLGTEVRDCGFMGRPGFQWSPKALTPPARIRNAPYIDQKRCVIDTCEVDGRSDLRASTAGAMHTLGEAFQDRELAASGAATQLAILSHHAGYDDARFGVPKSYNILPAYRTFIAEHPGRGPHAYGDMIRCDSHESKPWCGSPIPPKTQHYAYNIVAQHILAACYYGMNHADDKEFAAYAAYTVGDGYCTRLKVPTRDEVLRR